MDTIQTLERVYKYYYFIEVFYVCNNPEILMSLSPEEIFKKKEMYFKPQ